MSELDLLRLLQSCGEETDLADFTPEEIRDMLERLENDGEPLPTTFAQFKEKYFEYYDDVKDKTRKKQDW